MIRLSSTGYHHLGILGYRSNHRYRLDEEGSKEEAG
jgi:hypothetical protein